MSQQRHVVPVYEDGTTDHLLGSPCWCDPRAEGICAFCGDEIEARSACKACGGRGWAPVDPEGWSGPLVLTHHLQLADGQMVGPDMNFTPAVRWGQCGSDGWPG